VVNFAFGRRGTTLQTGTKTPSPVDFETARKTYDKLVREKQAKGYTPGEDGTPYQHTSKEERATGIFPQLLNPIDEEQALRLIDDPDWCAQEKFDGYAHIRIMRSPMWEVPLFGGARGREVRIIIAP